MPKRKHYAPKKVQPVHDGSDYSSSDDESPEVDNVGLNNYMDFESDDEQEEVLPVVDDSEEEDSDNEEKNNVEAWGKKKSTYFSADFVDEDRGRSYRDEDKETAKAEELDALEIQRNFLENIHTTAFETKSFSVSESISEDNMGTATTDWNLIDKKDKYEVVNRSNPELMPLLHNFRNKLIELKQEVRILQENMNKNEICAQQKIKTQLLLHYSMNASFRVMQLMKHDVADHPVVNMIKFYENMLNKFKQQEEMQKNIANYKTMKSIISSSSKGKEQNVKQADVKDRLEEHESFEEDAAENSLQEKRTVSYKIAKNKGLIPHRKKEYRNPRVKHRMKFKKAMIRRKGQVCTPRTETQRYGGEYSGIHANVVKSVKFK